MYRKIDFDIWKSPQFRALSDPPPCGKYLWLMLIVGKHTTLIPGVLIASPAEVCAGLGWTGDDMLLAMELFGDLLDAKMVEYDKGAGLIWLPKALGRNLPHSPNHVREWKSTWNRIPECGLKRRIWGSYQLILEEYRKGYGKVFVQTCGEALIPLDDHLPRKVSPEGSPESVSSKQETVSSPSLREGAAAPVRDTWSIELGDPFAPFEMASLGKPEPAPEPEPVAPPSPSPSPPVVGPSTPAQPAPGQPHVWDPVAAAAADAAEGLGSSDPTPHSVFIDVFDREFEKVRGERPTWGAKQGAMVKTILERTDGDVTKALRRMKRMFQLAPAWPAENPDLATLVGHWDKFAPPVRGQVGGHSASADQTYTDGEQEL